MAAPGRARDDGRRLAALRRPLGGVFLNGDAIAEPDPYGRPVVDDSFLLLLNSYWKPVRFRLPDATYGERWTTLIDTAEPQGVADETEHKPGTDRLVEARSLVLLSREARTARGAAG